MTARLFRPRVPLGAGAEFDLIRALLAAAPFPESGPGSGVLVGPGDDCAVIEGSAEPWAVTVDMSVEGVHFRRGWIETEEIGWRATAAALSDLAAVAAEPVAVLLALGLPPGDARARQTTELARGAAAAAASVGATIVGGDVTRSPGPLILDVVALGRAARPVLRDGATPGDELWVTGRLGAAAAAVRAWESGGRPSDPLRLAFAHPLPRVLEARWLAETGAVRALIDLSDGLAGDVGHIAAASGCRALLSEAAVPVAAGVAEVARDRAEALDLALGGGEDYELCLAAEAGALDPLVPEFQSRFGVPLTRVGRVVEGEGVALERADGTLAPLGGGWSHFEREPG
jgi:thiamine-monophosphate kinase